MTAPACSWRPSCGNAATGRCRDCAKVYCVQHFRARNPKGKPAYTICDACWEKGASNRSAGVVGTFLLGVVVTYFGAEYLLPLVWKPVPLWPWVVVSALVVGALAAQQVSETY